MLGSSFSQKPKAKWAGSCCLPEAEFSWRWDITEESIRNGHVHVIHLEPSPLSSPNKQNQGTQDTTVYMISNSLTGSPGTAVPLVLIITEEKNRSASRSVMSVPLCILLEAQFLVQRCVFHDTNEHGWTSILLVLIHYLMSQTPNNFCLN